MPTIGAKTIVNHVGLCVTDLERSRTFYEQVLGFVHHYDLSVPDAPASQLLEISAPVGLRAVYLRHGHFTLELLHFDRSHNDPARPRSFTEPGLTHLSFTVPDLPVAAEKVLAHGGEVLTHTAVGGAAIMVRDPDGQLLELLAPRDR